MSHSQSVGFILANDFFDQGDDEIEAPFVAALCVYNLISFTSQWKYRGFQKVSGSFDEYEYGKFMERKLLDEDLNDSSEDELYNSEMYTSTSSGRNDRKSNTVTTT